MKGLVMGKANVECYLCVHPKFLKLILDQCPEKERKGAQERIVLAILQKKLSVNFKYELTQSGILRPWMKATWCRPLTFTPRPAYYLIIWIVVEVKIWMRKGVIVEALGRVWKVQEWRVQAAVCFKCDEVRTGKVQGYRTSLWWCWLMSYIYIKLRTWKLYYSCFFFFKRKNVWRR